MFSILESLRATTGTNDKIAILKANEGNNKLKAYLQLALDNKITFGITKIPAYAYEPRTGANEFDLFHSLADHLANRIVTGKAAQELIESYFKYMSPSAVYWYSKCLEKDLSVIGIGRSTVEKVWPNLCGKFKCNLAEEEAELPKFDWSKGASVEIKLNGVRTLIGVLAGELVWIKGRSGLEIETFYPIVSDIIKALTPGDNFVLDGEVHCENSLEDTMTVYGTIVDKDRSDFKTDKAYEKWVKEKQEVALALRDKCTFDVFDIIPFDEFNSQTCSKGYLERRVDLEVLKLRLLSAGVTKVRIIDSIPVANKEEAISAANQFMVLGLEGGILKANNAKYEYKRARNFIKIKECTGEFEAEIIGIEISKDIFKTDGTLDLPQAGKITLRYRNPDGNLSESGCGTGKWLTKAKKEEIAANPDTFMNTIVTVSAQRFSEDNILIVPRIERARPDRSSLDE